MGGWQNLLEAAKRRSGGGQLQVDMHLSINYISKHLKLMPLPQAQSLLTVQIIGKKQSSFLQSRRLHSHGCLGVAVGKNLQAYTLCHQQLSATANMIVRCIVQWLEPPLLHVTAPLSRAIRAVSQPMVQIVGVQGWCFCISTNWSDCMQLQ